jgi:hypothetical protein
MNRKPKSPQKRGRSLRHTAGPHDRHFRVGCAHATLRFLLYPGNGITVFTKGEAMPDAH